MSNWKQFMRMSAHVSKRSTMIKGTNLFDIFTTISLLKKLFFTWKKVLVDFGSF